MSTVYDLLFADQDLEEVLVGLDLPGDSPLYAARARLWEGNYAEASALGAGSAPPWSSFLEVLTRLRRGKSATRTLNALASDPAQDSRVRLWAWRALRQTGEKPDAFALSEVLGIVIDVPVGPGTDVLAGYADGSVRYLNHGGSLVARGGPPAPPSAELIELLKHALPLLKLPPVERDPAPVEPDRVRFTVLAADGLHIVNAAPPEIEEEGPYHELFAAAVALLSVTAV